MSGAGGMAAGGNPAAGTLTEDEPKGLNWKVLGRIYKYLSAHKFKRNLLFMLMFLRAVLRPASGLVLAWVVNGAISGGNWKQTLIGAAVFLAVMIANEVVFFLRARLQLGLAESVVHDLRQEFFDHLQWMTLDYFNKTKVGSILSRMISDIENVRRGVQHVFFFAPMLFGMMLFSGIFMFLENAALFLILMTIAPVIAFVNRKFHGKMSQASRSVQRSQSSLTGKVAESVRGMRVIQGYVQEDNNLEQYQGLVGNHANNNVNLGKNLANYMALLDFNSQSFLSLLLAIGGYGALNGWAAIQPSDVIAFFFLSNHFFHPIQQMGRLYTVSVMAMAGAERIFSVLDERPDWEDKEQAPEIQVSTGKIQIHDLCFEYTSGQPVLADIHLDIPSGHTVALVGATGSGKSTLVNLIAKFYLPTQGRILIDDQDLAKYSTHSWREQISVVPQRNFLFTGSVLDNIRLGKLDATIEEVRNAARALDCLEILEALPDGFDTPVGENGHSLSVGTRQVICFVRAWLANPKLLILDEATSAIDTLTEARVQKALNRLLAGRSSIIIAHRLSTIRNADQICVLEHGRIVERGTHSELVANGKQYAGLHAQFVESISAKSA